MGDGPIFSGCVPFSYSDRFLLLQLPEIEVALMKNPSDIGFPSNLIFANIILAKKLIRASEKKLPSAGIEPRSPRTRFYEADALPLY